MDEERKRRLVRVYTYVYDSFALLICIFNISYFLLKNSRFFYIFFAILFPLLPLHMYVCI